MIDALEMQQPHYIDNTDDDNIQYCTICGRGLVANHDEVCNVSVLDRFTTGGGIEAFAMRVITDGGAMDAEGQGMLYIDSLKVFDIVHVTTPIKTNIAGNTNYVFMIYAEVA